RVARRPYIAHRKEVAATECRVLEQEVTTRSRPFVSGQLPFDDGNDSIECNPRLEPDSCVRDVYGVIEQTRIRRIGGRDIDGVEIVDRGVLSKHTRLEIEEAPHVRVREWPACCVRVRKQIAI